MIRALLHRPTACIFLAIALTLLGAAAALMVLFLTLKRGWNPR